VSRTKRWARHLKRQTLKALMQLSAVPGVGWITVRLAGALAGPYKGRRILAHVSDKSYVSPRAQIACERLQLGHSCFIDDEVTVFSHPDGGEVRLGDRVHLYRGTIIEVGYGGSVIIGDDSHIQAGCNLKGFLRSVRIGRNVQVAPQCGFSPYEHNFEDTTSPIKAQGIRSAGDIVLEDDVWLGQGVQVLEGVRIGRGAVIGAGAVVSKDVPAYAVAVGVPARVIRYRGETASPGGALQGVKDL
jgi:acetyltransferase-like isoleucine patch superfamily enzyme